VISIEAVRVISALQLIDQGADFIRNNRKSQYSKRISTSWGG
jgi:hypothetical protein